MLQIKNKKQSGFYIKKFGLNQFPKIDFAEFDEGKLNDFLAKFDAEYYAVRDLTNSNSSICPLGTIIQPESITS